MPETPETTRQKTTVPANTAGSSWISAGAACLAALVIGAASATAQTTPPRVITAPAAQPTAGAPKSIVPWLDKALSGESVAIPSPAEAGTSAGSAVERGISRAGAPAAPDAAPAPVAGANQAPGALPGRAPGINGIGADPTRPALTPRESASERTAFEPAPRPSAGDQTPMPNAGPFAGRQETPGLGPSQGNGVGGVGPGAVEVAPMHALSPSGAGVIAADELGMPQDGWSGVVESDAAALVDDLEPGPFHSVNRLTTELLSATFSPPRMDGGGGPKLLVARLDALSRYGASATAVAVGQAAGRDHFPLARDAALIAGDDGDFCEALVQGPADAGDTLSRIYCQAVLGDRYGAIAAIDVSRSLNDAGGSELDLLEAVADPDLASYVKPPASVADLTPITLAAMRRLRLDLPSDFGRAAPATMLSAALAPEAAPRVRLEALERLEQLGAIGTEELETEWKNAASAESGGVWGRVEAYRAALNAPADRFSGAIVVAIQRASDAGREATMARLLAPEIAARAFPSRGAPTAGLESPEIRRLLRLGGQGDAASALMLESARHAGPEERALDRIASAYPSAPWDAADAEPLLASAARGDRISGRMLAALNAFGVPTMAPDFFQGPTDVSFDLNEGRAAAVALRALDDISRGGVDVSPETFYASLQRLIALGLTSEARAIATEVVLLGR